VFVGESVAREEFVAREVGEAVLSRSRGFLRFEEGLVHLGSAKLEGWVG